MYSDKSVVRELAALLAAHGVRHVVVCAGSRSAPLTHTFAASPALVAHPCVDERSGAFEALGMAAALGEPVAVSVTSGSALMDASPALVEALYQEVPLVLISADRPGAWIDQRDGQTMRQAGALAACVKKSVDLPSGDDDESRWHANRLINEALLAAREAPAGPVHINVPLQEPLFGFTETELPCPRMITRADLARDGAPVLPEDLREELSRARRVLLVAGQDSGAAYGQRLQSLAGLGVAVVTEHLANAGAFLPTPDSDPATTEASHSGGRSALSTLFNLFRSHRGERAQDAANAGDAADASDAVTVDLADAILTRDETDMVRLREELAPDLVLTVGGHIVSKRLKRFLRACPPFSHWHVSANAGTPDLFTRLSRTVAGSTADFLDALAGALRALNRGNAEGADGEAGSGRAQYAARWRGLDRAARACLDDCARAHADTFADVLLVRSFMESLPAKSRLHLANSSTVRLAQYWTLPKGTRIFCNRGVNGIDGSLSAALGTATVSEGPVFCCVGDLSFFYDINALWREELPKNLRILLLNNGGGNIFRTLPGLVSPHLDSIAGANRQNAGHLAQTYGLAYRRCQDPDAFKEALAWFVDPATEGPLLLEATTDPALCASTLASVNAALAALWKGAGEETAEGTGEMESRAEEETDGKTVQ